MPLFGSSGKRDPKRPPGTYDRKREGERRRQAGQSATGRDIGPIPPIADPKRRKRTEKSLRLFCETYNPATFCWPWSEDHLTVIAAIEQSVLTGSLLAIAMPRGGGKTSLCRMATLWAVSHALVSYVFLVGANADKAAENLDAIKTWVRTLEAYGEDFPEIAVAARYLRGQANRANGMLCCGQPTFCKWEQNRIVLPRVPKPANLAAPAQWANTSGIVIGVSGLTGEGIRGSLFAHPDGRSVRPDYVLLDDPQTDESAASPLQNATRLRLINGAVLGMAGPGKGISAVMPCTVIRRGDMADRLLDRKTHPLWRGVRTSLLRSMPKNIAAWEAYYEVYRACMGQSVPDPKPANRYYRAHRKELDEGAAVSWPARKDATEVSAVQHAMNLRCRLGTEAFQAEYQNDPEQERGQSDVLTPGGLADRLSGMKRRVLGPKVGTVTAHVDVHDQILYWLAAGWEPDFTGQVTDYGTHPQQPVRYFAQREPPRKLSQLYPRAGKEGAVLAGLTELVDALVKIEFKREDGAVLRVGRILIDARYDRDLVVAFCRRSPHAALLMPAMGFYMPKGREWSGYWLGREGGQTGFHWRIPPAKGGSRYVLTDSNYWKTLAFERLRVSQGDPGAWTIFGRDPAEHAMLFDHFCAEKPVWTVARDLGRFEWEIQPGCDNDWWDNLYNCAVAAAMLGVRIPGIETGRLRRDPANRPTAADLAGRGRQ